MRPISPPLTDAEREAAEGYAAAKLADEDPFYGHVRG